VIITSRVPGEQLCWSEPWIRFSARTASPGGISPTSRVVTTRCLRSATDSRSADSCAPPGFQRAEDPDNRHPTSPFRRRCGTARPASSRPTSWTGPARPARGRTPKRHQRVLQRARPANHHHPSPWQRATANPLPAQPNYTDPAMIPAGRTPARTVGSRSGALHARQNRMRWHGRGRGVRPVVVQVHGR